MYGLIGKKLMHSYSKEIHEILHNEKYDLVELNELDSFFQEKTFKGLNITIPYKNEVIKYCDYLSETATITQSVNSIVNNDGKIYGYNTDYDGLKYLLDFNSISLHNKTILILGNGSTSRTIQYLCLKSKAKNITVSARNPQENEVGFMDIYLNENIDIIFNATPVGMYPNNNEELNIDLDSFENLETVIDLIYNPLETILLKNSKRKNIKSVNGLLMLVHQAVIASGIFHNKKYSDSKTQEIYKSILLNTINFVLIGMPMSGKSFIAKFLADKYHKNLIDIDNLIEMEENCSIDVIFKKHGEKYFRLKEKEIIKKVSILHNKAISTGGGTILNKINMENLKQNGIIIFLDVPLDQLLTFNPKNRPLLKDKTNIIKLYNERYDLYKKYADITIIKNSYDETNTFKRIEANIDEYINS